MPETKKYLSKIVKGGNTLHFKDAEARELISDIQSAITGAMHWKGYTTSELTDGATTNPVVISEENVTAVAGDVVAIQGSGVNGAADKEFVFNGTKWQEYGSTGSLKALAFKDSASTDYTPAGTNAASAVSFTGQTDGDFVTGFNNDAVAPSFTEGTFSQGTLPSFTEGEFSQGTLPSKAADIFDAGTLPTLGAATTGNFATAGETSVYDEENETLTFSDAATAAAVTAQGTFSQGTLPSYTEGAFSQGTLPSKAADTFDAGTLPSKAADTFNAGSAATPTTAKAITAVGTGEAAAQVFTGTQGTVTVS